MSEGPSEHGYYVYFRDAAVLLVFLGLIAALVWCGYRFAHNKMPPAKAPALKCPVCGAVLELKRAEERSSK